MELRVTDTEAAATLPDLLDRVSGGGDTVIIERDGKPAVRLMPTDSPPASSDEPGPRKFTTGRDVQRRWANRPKSFLIDDAFEEGIAEYHRLYNAPKVPESPWDR